MFIIHLSIKYILMSNIIKVINILSCLNFLTTFTKSPSRTHCIVQDSIKRNVGLYWWAIVFLSFALVVALHCIWINFHFSFIKDWKEPLEKPIILKTCSSFMLSYYAYTFQYACIISCNYQNADWPTMHTGWYTHTCTLVHIFTAFKFFQRDSGSHSP